jgi:hypothetical protein
MENGLDPGADFRIGNHTLADLDGRPGRLHGLLRVGTPPRQDQCHNKNGQAQRETEQEEDWPHFSVLAAWPLSYGREADGISDR